MGPTGIPRHLWRQMHPNLFRFLPVTIDDLPDHIITRILAVTQAVPQDTRPSMWTFSHVCRRWRRVATSNPELWRSIRVTLMSCRDGFYAADLYLAHSGTLPLDVFFEGRIWPDSSTTAHRARFVMNKLILHIKRWRSFVACTGTEGRMSVVLRPLRNEFPPILENLQLLNLDNIRPSCSFVIFSHGSPRLKFISLLGVTLVRLPHSQPLTALTYLDIHRLQCRFPGPSPPRIYEMAATLSNLKCLWITAIDLEVLQAVQLPSLRALWLRHSSAVTVSKIFRFFVMPRLRDLCIGSVLFSTTEVVLQTFRHEVTRMPRFPHLHALVLESMPPTAAEVIAECLRSLPAIKSLLLIGWNVDPVLEVLNADANPDLRGATRNGVLVPHLRRLELVRCVFDEQLLQSLVFARLKLRRPILELNMFQG
jgi:hypothetical protein